MKIPDTTFKVASLTLWYVCVWVFAATCLGGELWAQSLEQNEIDGGIEYSIDCTDVSVDYEDDPTLTNEEKTALMEQAFFRSLSKFDACQDAQSTTSSASSSGGGLAGSGSSGATSGMTGTETSESAAGIDTAASTASSSMSGTEETDSANEAQNASSTIGSEESWSQPEAQDSTGVQSNDMDNGKVPDDIPSADNDSILEAQIRQAATDETDLEIKARLWNEYRRYKGLPQVN
jgi:hypothetical protein